MKRYAFKDWNAVLASVGHGGIKEGQIINKMVEEKNKQAKKNITDTEIIEGISSESYKAV